MRLRYASEIWGSSVLCKSNLGSVYTLRMEFGVRLLRRSSFGVCLRYKANFLRFVCAAWVKFGVPLRSTGKIRVYIRFAREIFRSVYAVQVKFGVRLHFGSVLAMPVKIWVRLRFTRETLGPSTLCRSIFGVCLRSALYR